MNREIVNELIKLKNTIVWGKITSVYTEDNLILLKILLSPSNVEIDDVILINQSKTNTYPSIGTYCLVVNPPLKEDDFYAFAFDGENANPINEGEVCIYANPTSFVLFKANSDIDIVSNSNTIKINSNGIEITGNVKITGNLEVSGNSTLSGNATTIAGKQFLSHTHSGVTTGPGVSGGVV